jgi:hypothetical protein
MNKKNILSVIVVIGVMAGGYGYYLWNKPHQDMAAAKVDMALDAKLLYEEFMKDEAAANAKYLDKVIQVKGIVTSVDKQNGTSLIMLETGDPMGGVACELDPLTTHAKSDFNEGEEVLFKGTCSGKLSDVQLSRCVLVK